MQSLEIYSYIAFELEAPDTVERQVKRIRKEIRSLDFMPMHFLSACHVHLDFIVIKRFLSSSSSSLSSLAIRCDILRIIEPKPKANNATIKIMEFISKSCA